MLHNLVNKDTISRNRPDNFLQLLVQLIFFFLFIALMKLEYMLRIVFLFILCPMTKDE